MILSTLHFTAGKLNPKLAERYQHPLPNPTPSRTVVYLLVLLPTNASRHPSRVCRCNRGMTAGCQKAVLHGDCYMVVHFLYGDCYTAVHSLYGDRYTAVHCHKANLRTRPASHPVRDRARPPPWRSRRWGTSLRSRHRPAASPRHPHPHLHPHLHPHPGSQRKPLSPRAKREGRKRAGPRREHHTA